MILRAINPEGEIAGSIDVGELSEYYYRFEIDEDDGCIGPYRYSVLCMVLLYWVDEEGNPIEKMDWGKLNIKSNKLELFLSLPDLSEYLDSYSQIPGWIRPAPKRIIELEIPESWNVLNKGD